MPTKVEYETDEELVDLGDGIKIPVSLKEKLEQSGRVQTVNSIRRRSQDKLKNVLPEDFDWSNASPSDILDGLDQSRSQKEKELAELKAKKPSEPKKDDPDEDSLERIRTLENELASVKTASKEAQIKSDAEKIKDLSLIEVKSHMISSGLTKEQQDFFNTMVKSHFETSVENGKTIYRIKGEDHDYYVNDKLAKPEHIAKYLQDKYPGSFNNVKAGGGTGRSSNPSGTIPGSNMEKIKNLRQLEKSVWD